MYDHDWTVRKDGTLFNPLHLILSDWVTYLSDILIHGQSQTFLDIIAHGINTKSNGTVPICSYIIDSSAFASTSMPVTLTDDYVAVRKDTELRMVAC